MTLTAKDVAEITRLLEESSFDELYLELDGVKLSLKRGAAAGRAAESANATLGPVGLQSAGNAGGPAAPAQAGNSGGPAAAGRPTASASPVAASANLAPTAGNGGADPNLHSVNSPLLGTFYRCPKPGAPPYVEVGSVVEEDTIVGIIEVMKLMNTVRAGARGRVVDILARDGTLVEYGETLLRIGKPD